MTILWGVLAASLLGSLHCAGMCGAFVCFYAEGSGGGARRWPGGASHVAYNAGRLASYLALGAAAGALGATVDRLGMWNGVPRVAGILAGTLMVVWGVATVLATRGVRIPLPHYGRRVQERMALVLRALRERPPVVRAAVTGLVTTLLPCGWLYAFVATAAGSGSVWGGLSVMLFFWAGTLPIMLSVGFGAQRMFGPLRRRLPALTAATVVVLGLLTITGRLRPAVPAVELRHLHTVDVPR